jgi:hypothetical protein
MIMAMRILMIPVAAIMAMRTTKDQVGTRLLYG